MTGQQKHFGNQRLRIALVAADVVALSLGWIVSCAVGLNYPGSPRQLLVFGLLLVSTTIALFVTSRLYRSRMCSVRALETAAVLRACVLGGLLAWIIAGRFDIPTVRVRAVVTSQLLAVVFVFTARAIYRSALKRHRSTGRHARPVVLIGGGEEVYELHKMLTTGPELGYDVVGSMGNAGEMSAWAADVRYLGPLTNVVTTIRASGASGAIIAGSGLSMRDVNRVVREMLDCGLHVQLFGGLLGIDPSRLQMNPIGGEAAFYLEQAELSGLQSHAKRFLDIVVGSFILVLTAPIIAIFALLTMFDGGSPFFRQKRVGRDGEPFTMFKIRTMVMGAETMQDDLVASNERHGPLFKIENDPRLTRLGRFMDSTSINELPQLWNVVKGDMSLVGPRPALPREVLTFSERLLMRHRVRPGITGLWQVQGRDTASFATYERCDLFYVENWSTRLDLMILAQTAVHIVARSTVWRRRDRLDHANNTIGIFPSPSATGTMGRIPGAEVGSQPSTSASIAS